MLSYMRVQHDTQACKQQKSVRAQMAARGAPLLWEPWPLQAPSALKVVVAGSALLDALQGESARWFLCGGEPTRRYSCNA